MRTLLRRLLGRSSTKSAARSRKRSTTAKRTTATKTRSRSGKEQEQEEPESRPVHGERANFTGFVLDCIEADFCKQIRKLLATSTKYTPL